MVAPARLHHYTSDDYLLLEQHSQVRHEFLDGEIYAMVSGTPEHAALAAAVLRHISHDERRVELHRRALDGKWSVVTATAGQTVELESLGARLDVTAIYKDALE